MNKRRRLVALVGAGLLTLGAVGGALADSNPKVDICHATGSQANPYVGAKASETADAGGHDGHIGPIWFPGITVTWGDIIPPFVNGNVDYPGKNWTADGQAIWNNGCKIPVTPGPAVLSASKAVTEATAAPGDTLHYTLSVGNTGATDATNQTVSDNITALLAHGTFGTCDNGCSHDATSVSWTGLTIASATTLDLHFTIVLSLTGWAAGSTTHLGNTVVVADTNCGVDSVDPGCSTDTTVTIPNPVISGLPATNQPPTDSAFGSTGSSGPTDTAWLLVVALGVLLASIVVLTPARAKGKR